MELKTQHALRLVADGMTPYAAAKEAKITPQAVYRAQARERDKALRSGALVACPCCGSLVEPARIENTIDKPI
jgi:hypothetical protein